MISAGQAITIQNLAHTLAGRQMNYTAALFEKELTRAGLDAVSALAQEASRDLARYLQSITEGP